MRKLWGGDHPLRETTGQIGVEECTKHKRQAHEKVLYRFIQRRLQLEEGVYTMDGW